MKELDINIGLFELAQPAENVDELFGRIADVALHNGNSVRFGDICLETLSPRLFGEMVDPNTGEKTEVVVAEHFINHAQRTSPEGTNTKGSAKRFFYAVMRHCRKYKQEQGYLFHQAGLKVDTLPDLLSRMQTNSIGERGSAAVVRIPGTGQKTFPLFESFCNDVFEQIAKK